MRDEDWVWRPGCPKTALGHLSTWGSSGQGLPFPEGYQSDSLCPHTEKPLGGVQPPRGQGWCCCWGWVSHCQPGWLGKSRAQHCSLVH